MATITTTTSGNAIPWPIESCIERSPDTGHLWAVVRTTATQVTVFKSTDSGGSWASQGSFTRSGMYELGETRIDTAGDHLHIAYLVNESSLDKLYYKRIDIRSGTADFSSGEALVTTASATTAADFWQTASIVPIANPDGSYFVLYPGAFHNPAGSGNGGIYIYGLTVSSAATGFVTRRNDAIVQSTRQYYVNGGGVETSVSVSADWEHNGDGTTSSTPNVWLSYILYTTGYCLKLTWQGSKTGWRSPTSPTVVATGRQAGARDFPGRWDGKRFVIICQRPADTTKLDVFERNAANTGNAATRTSPSHSQGVVNAHTLSYNHVTQDLRIFAVGTTTGNLYYVDYVRATATWGAWTLVSATAPLTSRFGVRRSTYGTSQYDQWQQQGAASPWSVVNNAIAVNFAPQTPTWVTGIAGTVPTNGAAADVSASLLLDWTYTDPNPTDVQSQYALQRQIGTGTVQWWRTSDSTWQTVETFNTSASSQVTLTAAQWVGAGGASDPAHVYKVAVKDSGGLTSAYSAGLGVVPSTRVDPTLTAPTNGAILNTGVLVVNWTCADQSAYRITLTNTATSVVVHDSGFIVDPGGLTSGYQVPVTLPDGFAGSVTLQTKNGEGLTSVTRTAAFTIDFVEPVAPIITGLVADPTNGGIQVTATQAAASGTQPTTNRIDLYHRETVTTVATNANPYFETNANDWTNSGYASAARSTTFAHQGTASLFATPNGTSATPFVQTTAIYPIAASSRWEMRAWFRSTTANKTVRMRLQWYDNVNALISESTRDLTPVAGVWIWGWWKATAPSNAAGVRIAIGQQATPAAGDTIYFDELVLIPANDDPGIRIATGVTSGAPVLDWRVESGEDYEYQAYAVATNSTEVWGPWQA